MTAPIIDRDAIIEKAAKALVEHDADRMTCYDHMGACCPADGCAHGFTSRTGHQAAAVLPSIADDLLAPIEALHSGKHWCGTDHGDYDWYRPEKAESCPTAQAVAAIREAVRA